MWYRSALQRIANDQQLTPEQQSLISQLDPQISSYIEIVMTSDYGDRLLRQMASEGGLQWNNIINQLIPEKRHIYEQGRAEYESTPYHRLKNVPRYAPNKLEIKKKILRDIATGRKIGEDNDSINPNIVEHILGAKSATNEYEEYSLREQGRLLEPVHHKTLYHATTNMPGVVSSGRLMTRDELAELEGGQGLGGGDGSTISLTTSKEYAHTIGATLIFVGQVARGEISPQKLLQMAEQGIGADRKYDEHLKDGNNINIEFKPLFTGVEEKKGLPPDEEGWQKTKDDPFFNSYQRPLTEESRQHYAVKMARLFLMSRSNAGGMEDPFFAFIDPSKMVQIQPQNVGVITLRVIDNAVGYYMPLELEWRVTSGEVLEIINTEPIDTDKILKSKQAHEIVKSQLKQYMNGWKE